MGGGDAETPSAAPAETLGDEVQPTSEPVPTAATPPGEAEHRAVAPEGTATPQMLAMVDAQERDAGDAVPREQGAEALPLSPLRLAELIALAVLLLLVAATLLTAWLRRRTE